MCDDVDFIFVDDAKQLAEVCALIDSLDEDDFIGLDTEFMRITGYHPDFSLMQLAIHGQNYIIDMWMLEGRVKPVVEALCHTEAVVLAFACSEDIELLSYEARRIQCNPVLPQRLYDLQLMLAFCGHSFGRGLNFALQEFLGVSLAKDWTRSNWTNRPLTDGQLVYAALDVHYLESLYYKVREVISERNFSYFEQEMEYIRSNFDEEVDEEDAYLTVPAAGMLSERELNILQYLAKERQLLAEAENQALNRIITSKAMWQLARYLPRSKKELEHRGVKHGTVRQYGDIILKWIAAARRAPKYPNLTLPYDYFSHQRDMQANFDCLKEYIRKGLENSKICPQVLMKKQLLNDYFRAKALGYSPLLQQPWRLDLLGEFDVPLEPIVQDDEAALNHLDDDPDLELLLPPPFLT